MVELLQVLHADFVGFGDRGERLTFCNYVCISRLCCGRSGGARAVARRGRGCWRRFADHHAGPLIRDLLLQLQDLLRERVDLGVLLVDLLEERFELRVRFVAPGIRRLTEN